LLLSSSALRTIFSLEHNGKVSNENNHGKKTVALSVCCLNHHPNHLPISSTHHQQYFPDAPTCSQGASLQNYNNQLVKCIEDLREKREEVNRQILKEEEEKAKIQKDLAILTERLSKINESLQRKQQARSEYDQTIQETEAAYMKILESSQTLLHVLKRESVNLVRATATYRLQGVQGDTEEHCFSLFYFFLNSLLVSLCLSWLQQVKKQGSAH